MNLKQSSGVSLRFVVGGQIAARYTDACSGLNCLAKFMATFSELWASTLQCEITAFPKAKPRFQILSPCLDLYVVTNSIAFKKNLDIFSYDM